MRIRHPPAQLLLTGWFVGLALIIAGPLLGAGHLMLLDFVGGPRVPPFSFMPLPSSGEVGNTIPLLSLQAALGWVHPYVPQKLLLLAPIVVGGLGIARFAIGRLDVGALPAAYAGTLYAVNPFVYDRLTAGQLHLLLGYGLLPWAFAAPVRGLEEPGSGRTAAVAVWLAALTAVTLHVAGMFALLVIAGQLVGARWRGLLRAGTSLALAALLSAYWLVPSLFARQGPRVGLADLEVYASRPRGPGILPVLLGLHGFR